MTLLLTGVVVFSGFFGRYIYTAVPRTADGAVLERADIERRLEAADAELRRRGVMPAVRRPEEPGFAAGTALVLGRILVGWRQALRAWDRRRRLSPAARAAQARIDALVRRRRELQRQIATLATARRLLGVWHALHVPLGLILFSMVIVHIAAALYFATLLR